MDRRIKRMSQNDPWLSAPRIIAEIPEILVSPRTIQRRLVQAKLFSRRPAKKPLVSRRNRLARLAFAREHINWTQGRAVDFLSMMQVFKMPPLKCFFFKITLNCDLKKRT
jgi:hypothetical protein